MRKSLIGIAAAFAVGLLIGPWIVGPPAPAQAQFTKGFKFKGDCWTGFTKYAIHKKAFSNLPYVYKCLRGFGLLCKTGHRPISTMGPTLAKTAQLTWHVSYICRKS